ncbi:MAG: hypothetical protein K6E91_09865, partial [Butyrivibrio sp.]|nr:hypothetical protein [Butyrivibrio sp.]
LPLLIAASLLSGCSGLSTDADSVKGAAQSLKETVEAVQDSSMMDDLAGAAEDIASQAKSVAAENAAALESTDMSAYADSVLSDAADSIDTITQAAGALAGDSASADSSATITAEDLNFHDVDGKGTYYNFTYNGEEFSCIYTEDNWKILDSYKIEDSDDMAIICQVLIDEHPIHGKDMVSYRTVDDMVYEWEIHNLAYAFMDDEDSLKKKTKDVDFDPDDQGRTIEEFYKSRTGQDLDWSKLLGG